MTSKEIIELIERYEKSAQDRMLGLLRGLVFHGTLPISEKETYTYSGYMKALTDIKGAIQSIEYETDTDKGD